VVFLICQFIFTRHIAITAVNIYSEWKVTINLRGATYMQPNKPKDSDTYFPELEITPEQEQKAASMLNSVRQEAPNFWEEGVTDSFYLPVDEGEIRCFHWKPESPVSLRPVVFVPGWGIPPVCYIDYFEVLYRRVECYYLETREKTSSRMDHRKVRMDLSQKAKDIGVVLDQLDLKGSRDFVLMAPCWGAAMLLQGLIDKTINAPTIITVDPMHTLWFPKWILKYIGPILPTFIVPLLKPFFRRALLGDMTEPVQQQRAYAVLEDAEVWKWRSAAIQVRDYELYETAHLIRGPVIVANGTNDKIHDQRDYPRIARLIPDSRFIYMKTGEENREYLMGLIALEFAKVRARDGIPESLQEFEKEVRRQ
jgi:hypothetical protein